MGKVIFKAKARKFNAGFLLIPATSADKQVLNEFCTTSGDKIITVTANLSRNNKTYDQCKTVFALCAILFQCNYDRIPNSTENKKMYESMLRMFAPKEPDLMNPDILVPIGLSQMSKMQAAQFINNLISLIVENCELSQDQQITVRQLFTEFKEHTSVGDGNPCDYDDEGNLLTIDEWCERNNVSMCTGIGGEDLQVCHIVSKGAREDLRDYPWNWLRMNHYEHLEIQHKKGWEELLSLYPHLGPRVKNAFIKGKQPMPLDVIKGLSKIGLLDDNFGTAYAYSKENNSLAEEALSAASCN